MVAWNDRGEKVSLYIHKGLDGSETAAPANTSRTAYSTASRRSAREVYDEDIGPEVARRQWIAIAAIACLLFFVWLWAMNGGPLAALWAHD